MITKTITRNPTPSSFFIVKHTINVKIRKNKYTHVATRRIGLNIFLHWVFGPHRKPVEHIATMLPSEYGIAKFEGFLIALCLPGNHDKVAKKLHAQPRQKHIPNPHKR